MSKQPDHHTPAPLYGSKSGSAASKPRAQTQSRAPATQILHVPTAPSDWTKADKRAVTNAVGMGVFQGIFLWSIFAFILLFALS